MLSPDQTKYISTAPRADLDRDTLTALAGLIANGKKTVLLGFNDYAKHLINMFGETIDCVLDDRYAGVRFRGTEVRATAWQETEQYLVCDYPQLFAFKQRLYKDCHEKRVPFRFAPRYGPAATAVVDFPRLDPLYQQIFDGARRPASMLSEQGLFFLLEMLRNTLSVPGCVAEIGAWQGGSAWYLARMLELTGSDKALHVFEMGEGLDRSNAQGIVSEGQMARDLGFYPHAQCHFGPAIAPLEAHLTEAQFSFVFLDFGYSERILDFVWERMSPGAVLLLDNYGHTLGHPDLFDTFLAERGTTAVRLPANPTAFALKR